MTLGRSCTFAKMSLENFILANFEKFIKETTSKICKK